MTTTVAPHRNRRPPARRSASVDGLTSDQVARPAQHRQLDTVRDHPDDLPDPASWCASLARIAVEVALGGRPAVQLVRWLEPEVYERLRCRAGLQSRINGNGCARKSTTVRAVRVCELAPSHVEASVAVWDGWRMRAVAIRIEARRTRWMAVDLRVG